MNRLGIYVVAMILLLACNNSNRTTESAKSTIDSNKLSFHVDYAKQEVDTVVLSNTDSAFIVKNKAVQDDIGDKQKEYVVRVYFNRPTWPVLVFKNAIGAELALIADLDHDQQPELLFKPEWFSSCWSTVNLFSLKNNSWKLIRSGSMYFCAEKYPLNKRVVKTDSGYGLLTDSLTDDKFITLKKTIKF